MSIPGPIVASFRKTSALFLRSLPALLALGVAAAGVAAGAQTAHFASSQITIGSGLNEPYGTAVDGSGNVYIADFGSSRVLKETPVASGGYTQSVIASVFEPYAIAVDANGNVYVTDTSLTTGGYLIKETPNGSGGYTGTTITHGFYNPVGVAVDASGNVYVADFGANHVYKETLSPTGTYTQSTLFYVDAPDGVAVDAAGNLYVAQGTDNQVTKATLQAGGTYMMSTIGSGLSGPYGIAVDTHGNVYIADTNNNRILEETPSLAGGYTQAVLDGTGLNGPSGVALDSAGGVYIADTGNNRVVALSTAGVNFHTEPVASTTTSLPLTFTFDTPGVLGGSTVTTQGVAGLDFKAAATQPATVCTAGTTYTVNATCTVNVTFTPTKTGVRYGAATLNNSAGLPIATAFLYGTGNGPQVAFAQATVSAVGSGLSDPASVAAGAGGTVYIDDTQSGRVVVETPSAGGYTQTIAASGFLSPFGIAVDGGGNFYVANSGGSTVVKETLLSSGSYVPSTIGSGLNDPGGVAVDGNGNVYIADTANNRILKEMLAPSGSYIQSTVLSGLNTPHGVAVDGSGNLYITDTGNNQVLLETLTPAGSYTQSTVATGLNSPFAATVDNNGNVFIADRESSRVLKETPTGSGSYTQSIVAGPGLTTGVNEPSGVAVDSNGNVLIADTGNSRVLLEDYADAPTLNFAVTAIGSTSSDSPQTVTLENIGNAALTFPLPASGTDPSITSNFALGNSSTCPQLSSHSSTAATLAANSACTLLVSFSPVVPGSTGSLGITDTNLNTGSSTQTLTLNGIVQLTLLPAQGALPATTASLSYVQTFTASGGSTGTYSFSISGTSPPGLGVMPVGTNQYQLSGTPTTAGTYKFAIMVSDGNGQSVSQNYTLVVNPIPTNITSSAENANPVYSPNGTEETVDVLVTANDGSTPTGSVSVSLDGGSAATYAVAAGPVGNRLFYGGLAPGSHTVAAKYAPQGNYAASVAPLLTFVIGKATATVTLGSLSQTYSGQPEAATATTSPTGLNVTITYNGSTTAPTAAGSYTVVATVNDTNYLGTATGTLIISPASTPITFTVPNHTYGDASFTVGASSASSGAFTYSVVSGSATISGTTVSLTGVNPVTLLASQAAAGNYSAGSQTAMFQIAPAQLSITANSASRVYGAANPTFTGSVTGQKYNDTFTESFMTSATQTTVPGNYAINPTVAGANLADYAVTATSGTLTINKAPAVLALTTPSQQVNPSQTVTVNAVVTSTTTGTPTGSVAFSLNGGTPVVVMLTNGLASYTPAGLTPGQTNVVTATYSGDTDFLATPTTSGVSVTVATLDFTFTSVGPTAYTVAPGLTASYSFQLSPLYGSYAAPVSFTVTGLPPGASFTVTPATIAANAGPQTAVVTIQTAQAIGRNIDRSPFNRSLPVLALLLLPMLGRRRLRRALGARGLTLVLLAAGFLGAAALTGCGNTGDGFLLEQPQTYSVTVTAAAGSLTHSQTVTLIVQ